MEKITVDSMEFLAGEMDFSGVKILLIKGGKGALGCGYLNLAAAEKFGHALAIVTGVSSWDDMLSAEVKSVSAAAEKLGVGPGISGREALKILH